MVDLKFTRQLYRVGLGRPYVRDFRLAGGTYTGGAGFKTAEQLDGSIVGPLAANTPGETNAGLGVWGARTDLVFPSDVLTTQTRTVTAVAHTLSFYGTGTVTLSGASTAGPLAGSGANTRVSLTFTPSAGSLTLTVSGDVRMCNLEAGAFPTPYIPTTSAAATRTADSLSIGSAPLPPVGFILAEWVQPSSANDVRAYALYVSDTGNSRLAIRASNGVGDRSIVGVVGDGASVTSLHSSALTEGARVVALLAYDTTSAQMAWTVNGSDQTAARQLDPSVIASVTAHLGGNNSGGSKLNSNLRRIVVAPGFPTLAQRQALTA